jgi:hypothetical protein
LELSKAGGLASSLEPKRELFLTGNLPDLRTTRRRRQIFHIAGYDPVSVSDHHRRFVRQLAIFKKAWGVEASVSALERPTSNPNWSVTTEGPNWSTESNVELLAWDDLVNADAKGSRIVRLLRALNVYANLIWTGTLLRYAMANQRYFLFTIVPLLEAILLGVLAWSAALYVTRDLSSFPLVDYSLGTIAGLALFILLLEWPGRRWRIYQAFDDWILSLDYIYGRRAVLETRLDQFAERIVAEASRGTAEEIVIVGHSLGATFAIDAVSRALAIEPGLGRRGPSVCVVTVGATIPKCALHPHASRLRNEIRTVADEPSVHWVEYQSRADPISFYRFHPATLRRIRGTDDEFAAKPPVRRVHIKDMLQPETFAKYRLRVLRLHYQFVMANERRASYDYFMMICGPLLTRTWTTSPSGLLDFFADPRSATVSENAALLP